jgi:hypothetical protein
MLKQSSRALIAAIFLAVSCCVCLLAEPQKTFLDEQVSQQTKPKIASATENTTKTALSQGVTQDKQTETIEKKGLFRKKTKKAPTKQTKTSQTKTTKQSLEAVSIDELEKTPKTETTKKTGEVSKNNLKDTEANKELKKITKDRKKNTEKTIDALNFIQPSVTISGEDQARIDTALSRAEQEQLTILWRATLERNKTIHFIVQKLTPDSANQKKNQVLSQILNTAIFLPFYALQTVAPADTSQLASYIGAGLAGDLINGKARKNSDHMQLSQTEMVIMFMMIDQVAERLREQFHAYKEEKIDAALAANEIEEARHEAAASLQTSSQEALFLSQIRIRQIEREQRRVNLRVRSSRIVLVDLSGPDAVDEVDKLINKEVAAIIDLPPVASNT